MTINEQIARIASETGVGANTKERIGAVLTSIYESQKKITLLGNIQMVGNPDHLAIDFSDNYTFCEFSNNATWLKTKDAVFNEISSLELDMTGVKAIVFSVFLQKFLILDDAFLYVYNVESGAVDYQLDSFGCNKIRVEKEFIYINYTKNKQIYEYNSAEGFTLFCIDVIGGVTDFVSFSDTTNNYLAVLTDADLLIYKKASDQYTSTIIAHHPPVNDSYSIGFSNSHVLLFSNINSSLIYSFNVYDYENITSKTVANSAFSNIVFAGNKLIAFEQVYISTSALNLLKISELDCKTLQIVSTIMLPLYQQNMDLVILFDKHCNLIFVGNGSQDNYYVLTNN